MADRFLPWLGAGVVTAAVSAAMVAGAGTQDEGIYADPGDEIAIDTPAGQATAVALPTSLTKPLPLNLLQPFTSLGNSFLTFEPTCVDESMRAASSCNKRLAA